MRKKKQKPIIIDFRHSRDSLTTTGYLSSVLTMTESKKASTFGGQ